jgi:hypothetical protein
MTRTRVDSAAKHIMPAKIDSNLMKVYCGGEHTDLQTMHQKKLELFTEKDDLVLNVSRKVASQDTRTFHAYPAVVSTLANCTATYKMIVAVLYSQETSEAFYRMIQALQQSTGRLRAVYEAIEESEEDNEAAEAFLREYPEKEAFAGLDDKALQRELATMPFYELQGYSLGRAYASPISGDTVFSVLIGGCVTAQNGHFAMHAGQLVQWYFEFEDAFFSKVHNAHMVVGQRAGVHRAAPEALGFKKRKLEEPLRKTFVYPKPYVPGWDGAVYGDKMRIFGKCLNGAGPFEPVDIMIMTQSL